MVMSWIWTAMVGISLCCAFLTGRGSALAAATIQGAQEGITIAIAMSGAICLWTGLGKLMERNGLADFLAKLLRPALERIFPGSGADKTLGGYLSANITANFLGLGNAATPMGIQAAQRMAGATGIANDSLCRLIVLNTASIPLIPANVAALRSSLGSSSSFDILPAVWIASLCSASAGLLMAWILGKLWKHG